MSTKKPTIEEKLSQCIFYNLSILKQAVKTTADFDENLSNVIFLNLFIRKLFNPTFMKFFLRQCSLNPTRKHSFISRTSSSTLSIRKNSKQSFIGRSPKRKLRILTGEFNCTNNFAPIFDHEYFLVELHLLS